MILNTFGRFSRRLKTWAKPPLALRVAMVTGVTLLFLALLGQRLETLDTGAVAAAMTTVTPQQWALALAATALSFWAVGQYDVTLHRHLATGEDETRSRRAGMAASTLGQTLGLGVLTGALVRWRMLPSLSLVEASKLSAAVTLSFLFGWSMVTALVFLVLPSATITSPALYAVLGGVVLGGLGLCVLSLAVPNLRIAGRAITLPNLFTTSRILLFSLVDTVSACAALWLLFPPELALPFMALLPAYLLALGAGLISGTPGGIGAFEVTLLAALPGVTQIELIAAVLAFRLAYYALPALLGAAAALAAPINPTEAAKAPSLLHHAPAEAGLLAQNHLHLEQLGPQPQALAAKTAHGLVMLLDPFGQPNRHATLRAFTQKARAASRLPCLYKCSARMAATARAAGWHVAPGRRRGVAGAAPVHSCHAGPGRIAAQIAQSGAGRASNPRTWLGRPAAPAPDCGCLGGGEWGRTRAVHGALCPGLCSPSAVIRGLCEWQAGRLCQLSPQPARMGARPDAP